MDVRSTKRQIKAAVAKLYDIQTTKINTLIRCVTLLHLSLTGRASAERCVVQAGRREEGVCAACERSRRAGHCQQDRHHLGLQRLWSGCCYLCRGLLYSAGALCGWTLVGGSLTTDLLSGRIVVCS